MRKVPGEPSIARKLRIWSAIRWILIGIVCLVLGAKGWYFTIFDVYGLSDFSNSLTISMFAIPAALLLVVLDFRTAAKRNVLWSWIVLRAIAVPLLGLGIGSMVRVRIVTADMASTPWLVDSHAANYAWQLAGLGAALLAIEPLVGAVRRLAVALFGIPQKTADISSASVEPVEEWNGSRATAPKWPGSTLAKGIVGTVAFALIAAGSLTLANRVYWHIAVETWSSVPPMSATATIGGQEIVVTSYNERAFLRPEAHVRVAAYELETGQLVWDRRLPTEHGTSGDVDTIHVDERGAFLRMDNPSNAATWFILDPQEGDTKATADEGNLSVIDELDTAAPPIPGDVIERYLERDNQLIDDGYDYEFTDDADLERVFRYEDESLLINPVTGKPAGENHGFTLHLVCCRPTMIESRAEDGKELWQIDDAAPSAREVVAETESGRVVMSATGPESKGRLIIASRGRFTEVVIGERGWLHW